ncbi:GMP reductase 1 isoform X3 [Bubalus bubalis]|uniref:GMP reductase 1 isoform X3 n=1 Tax=Bubalus bubalis TaxID=89462 RepID=UPI001E1B75BB|nr:GMP reductase 1 isoform X3 [Bubalus bubalis]
MPRIDADLKLDFKDVLLRPKRSSLKSRAEVDLERTFTFRNSKQTYSGIPIIVANMDTVGTFEMAVVMSQHSMFTAIHKHYTLDDWKLFAVNHPECLQAGNVVTGEMVEELILSGADIIKVGVGPELQATAAESLPARIWQWNGKGERPILNQNQRFRVHHPHQDGGGLPPAERCDRVRRLGPWPEGAHHLGRRLHVSRRCRQSLWKCSHAFGRRGTTLGKNAGWERTQEHSEREVIGSLFKALLPELWSSGGLTGHQLSLPPYHHGGGTEELAFVLGTLQGSRQSLLPSREALCLACLIPRPRVQPCRAGLL